VQIVDGHIPLAANSGYKGDIEDPKERAWFRSVMNVINYMESSRIWKGKIVQISVDEKGELILIPREGKEKFIFGQPHSLEEKFSKMERYYTTIIPEKGSERYRSVDVRFEGQIVCK
jgi:cell division protein FtsQ